jgi:hypothetical protein
MKTRDPFLSTFGIWLDRAAVWLALVCITFGLLWSAIWERYLGQSWAEAVNQLRAVLSGQADRITVVLAVLTLAVSVLTVDHLARWLFARWRRQGELNGAHLRGSRIED